MDESNSPITFGEQWFSTALKSIGDAVIATDHRGRIAFMNPIAEVLTGWTEAEARRRAIVDSSDDAIVAKDLHGTITTWNVGAERILGYSAGEIIGQHVSTLIPPDHIEDVARILERVRRGEGVVNYQTKRRRKDGTIVDV